MHRSQTRAVPGPYHARSQSTQSLLPQDPPRSRRPSISNTMHWLSRSASPPPTTTTTKHARTDSKRGLTSPRTGTLGAGAIVVRTPDEALRETGVRLAPEAVNTVKARPKREQPAPKSPPTPRSPPLPPLPTLDADEEATLAEPESPGRKSPPRPTRAPPPLPVAVPVPLPTPRSPSLRSSLKVRTPSTLDDTPTVPPLPAHIASITQPPPFAALLVSDPPAMAPDPAKTIVTIETCTQAFRTTLATILARPSHLARFLADLTHASRAESMASMYSAESDDLSTYRRHLASQGLIPPTTNLHIFLDRASAPYAHILAYLRAPASDAQPETLPRALQLQGGAAAAARLEALIEVRDEAAFLALDGLHKLCADEIRLRYAPRLHTRGQSSSAASVHSQLASSSSVYSAQTLAERTSDHSDQPSSPVVSADPFSSNSTPRAKQPSDSAPARGPPTPQSWEGPLLDPRSQSRQSITRQSLKSPPAGWI